MGSAVKHALVSLCFHQSWSKMGAVLPMIVNDRLCAALEVRKAAGSDESYVASLFARGEDTILKKVGEEAVEFILAAKSDDSRHLVAEAADVWFHMLVMLSAKGLHASDILAELERREGVSGLVEKASRPANNR